VEGQGVKLVAEFGECIFYLKAASVGKDKLVSRWATGVWPGVRHESGETIVRTDSNT
jgi:hypothetical protein